MASPHRRWLRYSLRTLLVLITVTGIWLGIVCHRAREQAPIVNILDAHTAIIYYDYSRDGQGNFHDYTFSRVPSWLLEYLGEDFFHDVNFVHSNEATDDTLTMICRLPELRRLFLDESTVTNIGIAALKRLDKLDALEIDSPYLDDESLSHIASLPTLEVLQFKNSPGITDRGLEHLTALVNLRLLWLGNTGVTKTEQRIWQYRSPTATCWFTVAPTKSLQPPTTFPSNRK